MRPQDHFGDGRDWTFRTGEHGGDEPDNMPQTIKASDAAGRWAIYVPLTRGGKIVVPRPYPETVSSNSAETRQLYRSPNGDTWFLARDPATGTAFVRHQATPSSTTAIDRRHANSWVSLISPRYSTCRCTTRPLATRVFSTTLQ
jgi:hypothetical protein